jgi:hypothetical protein
MFDVCNVRGDDQRRFNDACAGYIAGASDVLLIRRVQFARRRRLPFHPTVDVILKYIREHPAQRNMAAPMLIGDALGQAFPCK